MESSEGMLRSTNQGLDLYRDAKTLHAQSISAIALSISKYRFNLPREFSKCLAIFFSYCQLQCLDKIEALLEIDNDDSLLWLQRSLLNLNLGNTENAVEHFRIAYAKSNTNTRDPLYGKGNQKEEILISKILELRQNQVRLDELLNPETFREHDRLKSLDVLVTLVGSIDFHAHSHDKKTIYKYLKQTRKLYIKLKSLESNNTGFYVLAKKKLDDALQLEKIYCCELFFFQAQNVIKILSLKEKIINIKDFFETYIKPGIKYPIIEENAPQTTRKLSYFIDTLTEILALKGLSDEQKTELFNFSLQLIYEYIEEHKDNNFERDKYICIGDIYKLAEDHVNSLRWYIHAETFSKDYKRKLNFSSKSIGRISEVLDSSITQNIEKAIRELEEDNVYITDKCASYIWWQLGKKIQFSKRKYGIDSYSLSRKVSIETFSKALLFSKRTGYTAQILASRSYSFAGINQFKEAAADMREALSIARNPSEVISDLSYRRLFLDWLDLLFQSKSRNVSEIIKVFKDEEKKYEEVYHLYRSNNLNRRLANIAFIQGQFLAKQAQKHGGLRQQSYLMHAMNAYTDSSEYIDNISSIAWNPKNPPRWVYQNYFFRLEVLIEIIRVGTALDEYQIEQKCLEEGSRILNALLHADKDGILKKHNLGYIAKGVLKSKFEPIEEYRISLFSSLEESLVHAETRKNICLSRLLQSSDVTDSILEQDFSIKQLEKYIDSQTAIIYWYMGIREIKSFILTSDSFDQEKSKNSVDKTKSFEYEREEEVKQFKFLKSMLREWKTLLNRMTKDPIEYWENDFNSCLNKISKALKIREITQFLNLNKRIRKIILVPHKNLHTLPLHLYFSGNYFNDAVNIDASEISYLPSLKIGLSLSDSLPLRFKLFGIHPSTSNQSLYNADTEIASVFIESFYSRKEIPEILEGNSKTTQRNINEMLTKNITYSHFHFTGHASHNYSEPENSALHLGNNEAIDFTHIIKKLDLSNYFLVCLSACETGVTTRQNILDEYVGLVSAFLQAGVNYIVSTLWRIDDTPSALLIIYFYRLMSQSLPLESNSKRKKSDHHPVKALKLSQDWLKAVTWHDLDTWCGSAHLSLTERLKDIPIEEQAREKLSIQLDGLRMHQLFAQQHVREGRGDKQPYSSPYYWAGFTITGLTTSTV